MSVYGTMLSRIPASAPTGKVKVIRAALSAGLDLQAAVAAATARDDLSAKGRAAAIETAMKVAGAALLKAKRQFEYHEKAINSQRTAAHKQAIGEPKPTDAEYRTYLRSLPSGERVQAMLTNAAARGAALREPGLSGLSEDLIERALEIAMRENAAPAADALADAEEAQTMHGSAIQVLTREIMETPFLLDTSGAVRKFISPLEMASFLNEQVPTPHPNRMVLEESEADLV